MRSETDKKLSELLMDLSTMEAGPEFYLDYEIIESIAQALIQEKSLNFKLYNTID